MKIITLNANGIRSAEKKGLFNWLEKEKADFICLQETKAQQHQLTDPIFDLDGYHRYFFDAEKKGYSGVAIYTRHQPKTVKHGLGFPCADQEGRYLELQLAHLNIVSLYLPSGSSGEARQALKFEFMEQFNKQLAIFLERKTPTIICGDWNIAHKQIDLKNWRGNQKNSGFLPEERAWLDHVFNEQGFVDAFRVVNTQPDQYTWWSNRGQARTNNVGWRIDYQVVTPCLKDTIRSAEIYTHEKFSDHAPLIVTYSHVEQTT